MHVQVQQFPIIGECRRKAPLDADEKAVKRVIGSYKEIWVTGKSFPVTIHNCWCGEFEESLKEAFEECKDAK
jgi:hypothetical protein